MLRWAKNDRHFAYEDANVDGEKYFKQLFFFSFGKGIWLCLNVHLNRFGSCRGVTSIIHRQYTACFIFPNKKNLITANLTPNSCRITTSYTRILCTLYAFDDRWLFKETVYATLRTKVLWLSFYNKPILGSPFYKMTKPDSIVSV